MGDVRKQGGNRSGSVGTGPAMADEARLPLDSMIRLDDRELDAVEGGYTATDDLWRWRGKAWAGDDAGEL